MIYEALFYAIQSCHFVIVSKIIFLTVPTLGLFSHNIYYFPAQQPIAATTPCLACNPLLFHVQSPVDLIAVIVTN